MALVITLRPVLKTIYLNNSRGHNNFRFFSRISTFVLLLIMLLVLPQSTTASPSRNMKKSKLFRGECRMKLSKWSNCSKSCDMGTSQRIASANCKATSETRLCMNRPCTEIAVGKLIKGKRRCVRHLRDKKKTYLNYIGGKSIKQYRMKYCGLCAEPNKCCTPKKTKTRKVWFKRKDGTRFFKMMMFIRRCSCHSNCVNLPLNDVFSIDLRKDTPYHTKSKSKRRKRKMRNGSL